MWLQCLHITVINCKNSRIDMFIIVYFSKIFSWYWLEVDGANCYSIYQLAPIDIRYIELYNGEWLRIVSSKKVPRYLILYNILWFCGMFFEFLDDLLLHCQLEYLFNACFQPCKRGQKNSHCKKLVYANSSAFRFHAQVFLTFSKIIT